MAGGADSAHAHVELADEHVDLAVEPLGVGAEGIAPDRALLIGAGLMHIQGEGGLAHGPALAGAEQQGAGGLLGQPGRGAGALGVGAVEVVVLQQQGAAEQGRVAVPAAKQGVEVGLGGGQTLGPEGVQAQADLPAGGGGDGALIVGALAAELDVRQRPALGARPQPGDAVGEGLVRWGQGLGRVERVEQAQQALVELAQAGEVVDNLLGGAQGADRQGAAGPDLDQAPAAQGAGGRQRVPVGAGQGGQGQAEGRVGAGRVALGRGAEVGEAAVELDPGAEQQRVALEGREAEAAGERVEGAGRAVVGAGRQGGGGVLAAQPRDARRKQGAYAGKVGDQRPLVSLGPAYRRRRAHRDLPLASMITDETRYDTDGR